MIGGGDDEQRAEGSTGGSDADRGRSGRGAIVWQNRLDSVVEAVRGMEGALLARDWTGGTGFADGVVSLTTDLLDDLDLHPWSDPSLEAELISTLRVYRNAAFVFRTLGPADTGVNRDTEGVCKAILEQGHDHLCALAGQIEAPRSTNIPPRVDPS